MKVIFLDIDGVLNSERSCMAFGGFGHMGMCQEGKNPLLDPVAVGLLRRLVEHTGAKIVLSSTWRLGDSRPSALIPAFEQYYGWSDAPIISQTPRALAQKRGVEIAEWLNQNGSDVTHYVIIDDDSDMLPGQMNRFVKTHFKIGLTYDSIAQAAEVLGAPMGRVQPVKGSINGVLQ